MVGKNKLGSRNGTNCAARNLAIKKFTRRAPDINPIQSGENLGTMKLRTMGIIRLMNLGKVLEKLVKVVRVPRSNPTELLRTTVKPIVGRNGVVEISKKDNEVIGKVTFNVLRDFREKGNSFRMR